MSNGTILETTRIADFNIPSSPLWPFDSLRAWELGTGTRVVGRGTKPGLYGTRYRQYPSFWLHAPDTEKGVSALFVGQKPV